jgi:hypothetical protein
VRRCCCRVRVRPPGRCGVVHVRQRYQRHHRPGERDAADGAFEWTLTAGPNVTLLIDGNDDRLGVNIPFQAGQPFTLTFGEFAASGIGPGNGARFGGLVVTPEPGTAAVQAAVFGGIMPRRRRR